MFWKSLFRRCICASAFLWGAVIAQGALLTFETLGNGSPTVPGSGTVGAQYSASGVTFSGGGLATQPFFRSYSSLSSSIATLPPAPNLFFIATQAVAPSNPFNIDVLFSIPVFTASGDVVVNPVSGVTVTAFDAANAVLGTQTIPAGASTWIAGQFNFVTATPIARINLTASLISAAAGLDNLRFDGAPVPEPSTVVLLGLGAGLALWRRRRNGKC